MADGLQCKHCGCQETEHEFPDLLTDLEVAMRVRGRRVSLARCPGFTPSARLARKIAATRAREAAWEASVWAGRANVASTIARDIASGEIRVPMSLHFRPRRRDRQLRCA